MRALRIALAAAVLATVFVLGVALGQALHEDGPQRARTQTLIRTLEPLPQRPATLARAPRRPAAGPTR